MSARYWPLLALTTTSATGDVATVDLVGTDGRRVDIVGTDGYSAVIIGTPEMAKQTHDTLFRGTDAQRVFHIQNLGETTAIDITGYALSYMVKRPKTVADAAATLTKTTANGGIAISGTFDSDPDVNTQRATVSILDTDTSALNTGTYYYELKRTDDGLETVLAYGLLNVELAVHIA